MINDDTIRSIGKLVSVSADHFVVELRTTSDNFTVVGFDDVHYVAALGSFVVIPVQAEYVVAEIVGLWEKDPNASKRGVLGPAALDKASSAKFLDLVPVGMLPQLKSEQFRFGVSVFPPLYADVLYVVEDDLDRIFDVADAVELLTTEPESKSRFKSLSIGTSVIFRG